MRLAARLISMFLFVTMALALASCGVNYHVNPGPRSWPAAPSAPDK